MFTGRFFTLEDRPVSVSCPILVPFFKALGSAGAMLSRGAARARILAAESARREYINSGKSGAFTLLRG
jgi:hypothetical protein